MVTEFDQKNCEAVLLNLCSNADQCLLPDNQRIVSLCSRLIKVLKKRQKLQARIRDDSILSSTGLGEHRIKSAYRIDRRISRTSSDGGENAVYDSVTSYSSVKRTSLTLSRKRSCYICKSRYEEVHHFYDRLCTKCGDVNFEKRANTANLDDMVAVLTGARIKIGFQTALKLLRAGATVVATSRFPQDAMTRYSNEEDFPTWSHRLVIYGLDLRSLSAIDEFVEWLNRRFGRQHILINNAALTIQRPPAFYADLMASEKLLIGTAENENAEKSRIVPNKLVKLNEVPLCSEDLIGSEFFPVGSLDEHKQQVDLRQSNSWVQEFNQVTPIHLLQTHLINAFAPFYLLQKLVPLLSSTDNVRPRFIINVSAVEGIFETKTKRGSHVHTNMAKASLNMITRTLAETLIEEGIYLNSVDTGWITNEFPVERVAQMTEEGFYPPLDEIDGAARVCDPIFSALNGNERIHGKFLKDFVESPW